MDDISAKQIGDYQLLSIIGDGAQGRVYKACAVMDLPCGLKKNDAVALKVVNIAGEDETLRQKFQAQADILRRLSHESIVKYIDSFIWHTGELDECQCLVMEYLEGEDLTARVRNMSGGLTWPQVEDIFEKCLAALIHARECGITHRDIKPSNIYLTRDGKVKLIDFDIARRDDSEQLSTAGWKGTFDYMAPDFITLEGFHGDEISDIFSLGVCFYQALTGALPYEPLGSNAHIGYVNRWHSGNGKPPSFRFGVFRVLAGAKSFVARALAVKREERYHSFTAMLEDFRRIHYRVVRHKGKEDYELIALLGRGGFGEVFKARCVSDGRLVAVKHLFSAQQSGRFIKEAKILQRYNHENLVQYVDFMTQETNTGEQQFFLVMEHLEGMPGWTLRTRIKNEGRIGVQECIKLFHAYLQALDFLHGNARPIIHRDIKPGNLYAPVGRPEKGKIFDLGVARDVSGTVTVGGVPGTLDYMAPEFADASGDRGSPRSDLYALGLCLYEALTGKTVYERLPKDINSAWSGFLTRMKTPPAVDFSDPVFTDYPRLVFIVKRMIAINPAERFATAGELSAELERALLPPEAEGLKDDCFDDVEVTMATTPGGEGVTLGTRPMQGDINQYLEDIGIAGRSAKKSKRTLFTGRAAVLVLVASVAVTAFVFAIAALRSKKETAMPSEMPSLREQPVPKTETIVKQLVSVADYLPAKEIAALVPGGMKSRTAIKNGEKAMRLLAEQEQLEWQDVDKNDKEKFIASERAKLKVGITDRIKNDALEIVNLSAAGKNAEENYNALLDLRNEAPLLIAGVKDLYQQCCEDADRAIKRKLVTDTVASMTAKAGKAAGTAELVELLAGFSKLEAMPQVEIPAAQRGAFKTVAKERSLTLATQLFEAFKIAVNAFQLEKSEALRKEFELLHAAVNNDYGKAEFDELAPQFDAFVKDAQQRKTAAAVPPVEKKQEPATVERIDAVVKPDKEETVPAATPIVKIQDKPPKIDKAADKGKSYLEITVSPDKATVQINGEDFTVGRVEVEPGTNHRVDISCPGYQSVRQFYRVEKGKTRKVDILLQKGKSRSLFGF